MFRPLRSRARNRYSGDPNRRSVITRSSLAVAEQATEPSTVAHLPEPAEVALAVAVEVPDGEVATAEPPVVAAAVVSLNGYARRA
ncbi:MAG: hypothetical protein R2826_00795 [Thermoleophilia bacterium]